MEITFLGFLLNSETLEFYLPTEKINKIKDNLRYWSQHRYGTKRELLSLIGSLQHCCQAVVLGSPFLRRLKRLKDRASSVKELHYLSVWERDDIAWWNSLLTQ